VKNAAVGLTLVLALTTGAEAQSMRGNVMASAEIVRPITVTPAGLEAEALGGNALSVSTDLGISAPVPHAVSSRIVHTGPDTHRWAVTERKTGKSAATGFEAWAPAAETPGPGPTPGKYTEVVSLSEGAGTYRVIYVIAAIL